MALVHGDDFPGTTLDSSWHIESTDGGAPTVSNGTVGVGTGQGGTFIWNDKTLVQYPTVVWPLHTTNAGTDCVVVAYGGGGSPTSYFETSVAQRYVKFQVPGAVLPYLNADGSAGTNTVAGDPAMPLPAGADPIGMTYSCSLDGLTWTAFADGVKIGSWPLQSALPAGYIGLRNGQVGGGDRTAGALRVYDSPDTSTPSTPTVTGVMVSPATAVASGTTPIPFSAAVSPSSAGQGVTWSSSPAGVGSVDSSGNYTPAAGGSADVEVTITATSTVDPSYSGQATVTIPAASSGGGTAATLPQIVSALNNLLTAPRLAIIDALGAIFIQANQDAGLLKLANGVKQAMATAPIGSVASAVTLSDAQAQALASLASLFVPANQQAALASVFAGMWGYSQRTVTAFGFNVTLASGGLDQVIVDGVNARQALAICYAGAAGVIVGPGAATGTGNFTVTVGGATRMTGTMLNDARTAVTVTPPA